MKSPKDPALHSCCPPLNNYSVNSLNQLLWRPGYILSPPLSPIWLLLMSLSIFLFFFFFPFLAWQEWLSYTEDRRGAELLLSRCWAPVQALGRVRCELHTSHQWQQWLLLWLRSALCADSAWPVHSSCPSKAAPRAVCSEPNPACQISLQVTWLPPKHT